MTGLSDRALSHLPQLSVLTLKHLSCLRLSLPLLPAFANVFLVSSQDHCFLASCLVPLQPCDPEVWLSLSCLSLSPSQSSTKTFCPRAETLPCPLGTLTSVFDGINQLHPE